MKKTFLFCLFLFLCGIAMAQNPPLVTYKPVIVPRHNAQTSGYYQQNTHSDLFEAYHIPKYEVIEPFSEGETITTYGYYYSQRTQSTQKIKLKILYREHFSGEPDVKIIQTCKMGENRWENRTGHVHKVSIYEDGEHIANNFEYKCTFSSQIVYFNL